ncbi:hypothetical protein FRC18_010140 [Serendipita sp. 400]|nr:hypothetical protein FRC18_010140 [Serendipita sp. 400]
MFLDESAIARLFAHLPGGVKKVWLNRDLKELPDVYDRRLKAANKLESAEIALLKTALKLNKKANKGTVAPDNHPAPTEGKKQSKMLESATAHPVDAYVPPGDRPTHRLPVLGFLPFGKKVDTIEWATKEIQDTTEILEKERALIAEQEGRAGEKYPPLNSVFVLFNQQIGAHLAAQSLTHNKPYRMAGKYTEVAPADVVWENLGMNPYEARIRQAISYAATAALIIFWAIPVAFVGIVANVSKLCETSWLSWVCKMPPVVLGIVQGILPPVALAILMMLLPIVLRLFGHFEGIPRKTGIELSLMTRFFIFQVVHGFLVTTISGSITSAIEGFSKNPTQIPMVLAQRLPTASTFFLTYAILQALSGGKAMGGVTVALIIVTAFFHMVLNNSYKPLLYSLPLTLAHKSYGMPQTGEGDDTNEDESADFGGDASPTSPSGVKASKKREESVQEEKILVPSPVPNTSHVQHNQGPGPSRDYGASVPVEGKRNEGPTDFNHPASVEPQRVIWIPEDPLGIGKIEADHLNSQGVEASTENATMGDNGKVDVQSHPPGSDPNTMFG